MNRPTIQNVNINISYVKNNENDSSNQQSKIISRTIILINPDGKQTENSQKVQLVRDVIRDDVGGYVYGDWHVDKSSPKVWNTFTIPQLKGYNSYANGQIVTELPSVLINDSSSDLFVIITYTPKTEMGKIAYIDPNGKAVKTDQVSGKVGDKVDVKISLPDGYELANKDEHIPSTITVGEDGISPINVNVKKINTTLANNEVPYDSTTISNNVNANYGYLDSYKLTENNQGQAQLIASGWHATGASNSDRYRYMIVFDNTLGHEIARQKLVPQVRSDVQRAYSNVDNSLYSGFNVTIDIPNSCINHSLRLVSRYSNDPNHGEGARVDYWFNSLALKPQVGFTITLLPGTRTSVMKLHDKR